MTRTKFEVSIEDEAVCSQQTIVVFGIWRKLEEHVHSSDRHLIEGLVGTYTLEQIQLEHAARLVPAKSKDDIHQVEFHRDRILMMMSGAYR